MTDSRGRARVERAPKLLYIVGTYPSLTTTFIDREVSRLRALGIDLRVISIRTPPLEARRLPEYEEEIRRTSYLLPVTAPRLARAHLSTFRRHPLRYLKTVAWLVSRHHPSTASRWRSLLHFGEAILAFDIARGLSPDHIHAHFLDRASIVALIVGRFLDVGYSVTAHANDIYVDPVLLKEKLENSAFVVTVSEFNKSHLLGQIPSVIPSRVAVLHPWVDVKAFTPPSPREPNEKLQIVSVGRLVEKKGHAHLIRACALLRDRGLEFTCTIIGSGPLDEELQRLVAEEDLETRVLLAGPLSQTRVRESLVAADVFVLACTIASDGDRDGIPVSLAEAMALELPVISTDIVGIGELVQPGTGWLVPDRDPESIANALEQLAQMDVEQRRMVGQAGRRVVAKDFDLATGVQRLADLFEKTIWPS